MPDWLEMEEVLTEAQHRELVDQLLADMEAHVNPVLARNMRILEEDFTEWRASGSFVHDPRGRAYYDAVGAGGVFALGHSHPKVVEAVRRQLDRMGLSPRMGLTPWQTRLFERLSKVAPGHLAHGFLGSSGTEAVEAALKLARLTTGRPGFVGMELGYHGLSLGTLSVSGVPYWRDGIPPLLEPVRIVPFNDLEALEQAVDETTAAVILEPVQWASGCTPARVEYLRGVRALCDRTGALLIADEIQTGLGRTGRWFGVDHAEVIPDLLCMGKILSGGVIPISAVLYGGRVQAAAQTRHLFNNSTYGGNPLACAAAVATLEVLESEGLVDRAAALGRRLEQGLASLCRRYPGVLSGQQGLGTMRCLFTRDPRFGIMLSTLLNKEHSIMLPSMAHMPHVLRMSPPFLTTEAEISALFQALEASVQRVAELGIPGIMAQMQEVARKLQAGGG